MQSFLPGKGARVADLLAVGIERQAVGFGAREFLRKEFGSDFILVTPGVRPAGSRSDDQARSLTPREALRQGADYLVIGRPITQAPSPREAAQEILHSLS